MFDGCSAFRLVPWVEHPTSLPLKFDCRFVSTLLLVFCKCVFSFVCVFLVETQYFASPNYYYLCFEIRDAIYCVY